MEPAPFVVTTKRNDEDEARFKGKRKREIEKEDAEEHVIENKSRMHFYGIKKFVVCDF